MSPWVYRHTGPGHTHGWVERPEPEPSRLCREPFLLSRPVDEPCGACGHAWAVHGEEGCGVCEMRALRDELLAWARGWTPVLVQISRSERIDTED